MRDFHEPPQPRGKQAPTLVTTAMVEAMKPGSVIVDLAVEMGGNVEGSAKGKTVIHHGVKMEPTSRA